MKLLVVGVLLYVVQLFLLPLGVQALMPYIAVGLPMDPKIAMILFYIVPMTALSALAAYAYARFVSVPLTVGMCIAVGVVFLLMPIFDYIFRLGVAFYVNPLLAVEDLQMTIVPLFESFERNDLRLVTEAMAFIPIIAPALLGPCLASFFARAEAVAKVRILMDEPEGELKL